MTLLLLVACEAFQDASVHTGTLDSSVSSCSGLLEAQPASGVTVLTFSVDGVGRVVSPTGLCVHPEGTTAELQLDDGGVQTTVRVTGELGVSNLPGPSVLVSGGSTWQDADFYAGTLNLAEGTSSLVGDATNGAGDALAIDIAWTWVPSPF